MTLHKEVCWINDSPVLSSTSVAIGVKPRFLKSYNVPVVGVSYVEDVRLSGFGFVSILLPYSELLWIRWGSDVH